jgi:hypothetical protein
VTGEASPAISIASVRAEQRSYAAYDAFHGTNSPMLWRQVTITTPTGIAVFEQTDYGHPGRLNPWQHRGIPVSLQARADELEAVADRVAALLA